VACRFVQYHLRKKYEEKHGKNTKLLTFIHPNCFDFGGGEKVLWMIINALTTLGASSLNSTYKINIITAPIQLKNRSLSDEIFTVDNPASKLSSHKDLLKKLNERFAVNLRTGSELIHSIELIQCRSAAFFEPMPFLTMLFQVVFQMVFAVELSFKAFLGEVVFDTTGLPFSYSVLSLFGNAKNVAAYVHYPFISDDMLADIREGSEGVHSRGMLAKNKSFRKLKLLYYSLILKFYKFNCWFLNFMFCNSTWTASHMKSIAPKVANQILYPPCGINVYKGSLSSDNVISSGCSRENVILSFAQFRPEKNHRMQINILQAVRKALPNLNVKLWLIGGVRNQEDQRLLDELKEYVESLGLTSAVEFLPNLNNADVKTRFQTAKIGIHTMRDEHFGISVIEMMCSGLVTIAHKSAGPLKDIIGSAPQQVGLLCEGKIFFVFYIFFF